MIDVSDSSRLREVPDEIGYRITSEIQDDFERHHDPKAKDFITPQTRKLFEWYETYKPSFPKRDDFDIMQHWTLASHLYLIEAKKDDSFHYRLNGERVIDIIGTNQSGLRFGLDSDLPVNATYAAYLRKFIKEKTIVRCMGNMASMDRSFIKFESLDCPMIDQHGEVTHIIGVISMVK